MNLSKVDFKILTSYIIIQPFQTTILNGVNGQSFLDNKMTDSGGSHSLLAGLSISQSFGGDLFLHWQLQCRDKYDAKDPYTFIPGKIRIYRFN